MNFWKRLGFSIVFVVPALIPFAAWLGHATGHRNAMAWFPLLFLFVMLPAADYIVGRDARNPDRHDAATLDADA